MQCVINKLTTVFVFQITWQMLLTNKENKIKSGLLSCLPIEH